MTACTSTRTNPFLTEWNTPLGIPPFEQIQEADYLPALEEGIKQHDAEIAAIIANPDAPTFDNVIAAYDQSGLLLAKVVGVLFNLAETDNTPTLEKIVEDATPGSAAGAKARRTASTTHGRSNGCVTDCSWCSSCCWCSDSTP